MTLPIRWTKYIDNTINDALEHIIYMNSLCIIECNDNVNIVKYMDIVGVNVSDFIKYNEDDEYRQTITLLLKNSSNDIILDDSIIKYKPDNDEDEAKICRTIEISIAKHFAKYIDNYLKK